MTEPAKTSSKSKSPTRAASSKSPKPTMARSKSPKPTTEKARSKSPKPTTEKARSKNPKPTTEKARSKSPKRAVAADENDNSLRTKHVDDAAFEEAVRRCIPADFTLIAGQDDLHEAEESYGASDFFRLPNPIGEEGGVATSALLQYMYTTVEHLVCDSSSPSHSAVNTATVLKEIHVRMQKARKSDAKPQLSSSRPMGPLRHEKHAPFYIVPPKCAGGRRRALLIGINFVLDNGQKLRAPHNDVHNMQQFLMNKCGFQADDMMVLTDNGEHVSPTKKNIEDGFAKMVELSQPNDVLFIQYSGHGGRVKDLSGDELDGYDSYILPVDYKTTGQILDDDILKDLVKALSPGVHATMLADCCHSGTVGDLPYVLKAGDRNQEIECFFDTDTLAEILEKEAQAGKALEERKRAKAERRRQREIRKKEREQEEKEEAARVQEGVKAALVAANAPGIPSTMPMTMQTMPSNTMQTVTVRSEAEVPALSKKYGMPITLSPEQKACLKQGGVVTLSFSTPGAPQAAPMMPSAMPMAMTQNVTVRSEAEVPALCKQFGVALSLSPEQKACLKQGGVVTLSFSTPGAPQAAPMMPSAMPMATTQNVTVRSEAEVPALCKQFGVALSLSPEQKACLKQGGVVTLSFTTQPAVPTGPMTMQTGPMTMSGGPMVMMTTEQAEAFKKANGGVLMMSPEQAAAFAKANK